MNRETIISPPKMHSQKSGRFWRTDLTRSGKANGTCKRQKLCQRPSRSARAVFKKPAGISCPASRVALTLLVNRLNMAIAATLQNAGRRMHTGPSRQSDGISANTAVTFDKIFRAPAEQAAKDNKTQCPIAERSNATATFSRDQKIPSHCTGKAAGKA